MMQLELIQAETISKFPTTRYQGSKLKYIEWIWECINDLEFSTVLDAFGGTGAVSYKMKQEKKSVTYNDILKFNSIIGKALIENNNEKIEAADLEFILRDHDDIPYPTFIQDTFKDIYFTDDENKWLDKIITNINHLDNEYKEAIALFALFQSCIIKRPYNLFHRKNLYIRTQDVERSFGNKVSWDTPFEVHFKNFIKQANNSVFDNDQCNRSINHDVFEVENNYDLIYIDTPYVSSKGVGLNYLDFYHFLEGIVNYNDWDSLIDYKSKHKRLKLDKSSWTKADIIEQSFERLISQFKDSILVISYRSDGIPSIERIKEILISNGKVVEVFESREMKYALSKKQSSEVLIIAQ